MKLAGLTARQIRDSFSNFYRKTSEENIFIRPRKGLMGGFYEHGNEPLDFLREGNFFLQDK